MCVALVCACASPRANIPLDEIADVATLRAEALALVNDLRRQEGVAELRSTRPLNAAAQAHAEDMARRAYYGHRSPEGRDVANRYRANGGQDWRIIGENIAQCRSCSATVQQVRNFHDGWLASPGHRRNMVNAQFDNFGFGVASAGGRLYAVQTFVGHRR